MEKTMQVNKLSQANQTFLSKKSEPLSQEKKINNSLYKNGKKLLMAGAVSAANLAVAGIILYKKHNVRLKDIEFKHGTPYLKKTGEIFSGNIRDILKNGDKTCIKYKNGVLKKSKVSGKANFVKRFSINDIGERTVIYNKDKHTINLIQLKKNVKEQQEIINKALEDDTLSKETFDELISNVEYINNIQRRKIVEKFEQAQIDPIIQLEGTEIRDLAKTVAEISQASPNKNKLGGKKRIKKEKLSDGTEKKSYENKMLYWEKFQDGTQSLYLKWFNFKITHCPKAMLK